MAPKDPKSVLHRYLQDAREALLWKLEGLTEYEIRRPMTPTGTNLLGIVKHVASVELGYLGDTFGRPSGEPLPWFEADAEPNADMWATPDESREDIVGLYRRSWAHGDATIGALPLDAPGHVAWWPDDRNEVTLHEILVRMIAETNRHAGHADIVREMIDGSVGMLPDNENLPHVDATWWSRHRARLEHAARTAAHRSDVVAAPPGRPRTRLSGPVLDAADPLALAAFYERLLGWSMAGLDEPSTGRPPSEGWAVLRSPDGKQKVEIQGDERYVPPTWPSQDGEQRMMMHLDIGVDDLDAGVAWAVDAGATLATHQPQDDVRVMIDPEGHPFCLFADHG